jgi:two-component system cell cycle response regulator
MPAPKVLIVDDDPLVLQHVRSALSSQEYELFEAEDGARALSAIREQRPDLVIMDVEMPQFGGVEVCRILKANERQSGFGFIPVVLMATRQLIGKIQALGLGVDEFLVKPVEVADLTARTKSMLRLKLAHDELRTLKLELDRTNDDLDKKRQELLAANRVDPLTGLFNKRYFEERLAFEFARANRYRIPLSCMMLDIDHLRAINESFGQEFGDQVLKEIAKVTRQALREVDLVARYGGEEFTALLPETGPRQAFRVSERVRQRVGSLRVPYVSSEGQKNMIACTISIGVATFPIPSIDSSHGLLRAADASLYAAKGAGKNAVMQYQG